MYVKKTVSQDSMQLSVMPFQANVGKGMILSSGDSGIYYLYYSGRVRLDTSRGVTFTGDTTINIDTSISVGSDTIKVDTNYFATVNDLSRINIFYGDGGDGSYTLDGVQDSVSGLFGKSGSTYTLSRDVFFDTLQIDSAVTLDNGGYRIFIKSLFTNNGTLENNGINGVTGDSCDGVNGGGNQQPLHPGQSYGYMDSTGNGGSGGNGANIGISGNGAVGGTGRNVDYGLYTDSSGGTGGAGGSSDCGYTGGAGGAAGGYTINLPTSYPAAGMVRDIFSLLWNRVYEWNIGGGGDAWVWFAGPKSAGGGGGGAGGGVDCLGGGGGTGAGNGGWLILSAQRIAGNGTISADGGRGGDGGKGGGSAACASTPGGKGGGGGGGGGGGAGGLIVIISNFIGDSLSIHANGGLGGDGGAHGSRGGSNGSTGNTGQNGTIWQFELLPDLQ